MRTAPGVIVILGFLQLFARVGTGSSRAPHESPHSPAQGAAETATEDRYTYRAVVRWVVDGDTLVVDVDLGSHAWPRAERLRLARINVP